MLKQNGKEVTTKVFTLNFFPIKVLISICWSIPNELGNFFMKSLEIGIVRRLSGENVRQARTKYPSLTTSSWNMGTYIMVLDTTAYGKRRVHKRYSIWIWHLFLLSISFVNDILLYKEGYISNIKIYMKNIFDYKWVVLYEDQTLESYECIKRSICTSTLWCLNVTLWYYIRGFC